MESAPRSELEPFGRQPQPVHMFFTGEQIDIEYWMRHVIRAVEFKGDITQRIGTSELVLYPRAVND